MPKLLVFVSSPGGTKAERDAVPRVLEEINATSGSDVELVDWRWEKHSASRMGRPPQKNIDDQLPKDFHIYLGIMGNRFGSPTEGEQGEYGSGTEYEFRAALQRAQQDEQVWMLFYFNAQPPAPQTEEELEQYAKVLQFKKKLQVERAGIFQTYVGLDGTDESFCRKLDHELRLIVKQWSREAPPGTATQVQAEIPQRYRTWLLRECARVDLGGLRIREILNVRLSQVYVPLTTHASHEAEAPPAQRAEELAQRGEKQTLILDLLGKESLYVSGDAGTGKSTFCRWLAFLIAGRHVLPRDVEEEFGEALPDDFAERLPLYVRLREFWPYVFHQYEEEGGRSLPLDDLLKALKDWFAASEIEGLDWPTVQTHLDEGKCLLMFDGVDEVPPSRGDEKPCYLRDMIVDGLSRAAKAWGGKGNRLLVTSRPYGLDPRHVERLGLKPAPISDLPEKLQHRLALRWFTFWHPDDPATAAATQQSMFGEVRERDELDAMTQNPMLLTAICVLYASENKRLPRDKFELYDRLVENVLHSRYGQDNEKIYQVHNDLRAIAYGMHTGESLDDPKNRRTAPQERISDDEIELVLHAAWPKKDSRAIALARDDLLGNSGLLRPCGVKTAEFAHLSFQEFLAGREYQFRQELPGLAGVFVRHAGVAKWRNALSFVFGALLANNAPASKAVGVIEQLLDQTKPLDDTLGLQVVLADCIHILLDKQKDALAEERKRQFIDVCLSAIEPDLLVRKREVPAKDRLVLGLILGKLGDPRIVDDLHDPTAFVKIPAGPYKLGDKKEPWTLEQPFLLSRYPVTNSQFKKFIEANGYAQQDLWCDDQSDAGWRWLQQANVSEPALWGSAKWNAPNQPVVGVSFWEAQAFAKWAGGCLPSEKEWEAAARGPQAYVYPWGDDWDQERDKEICNWSGAGLGVTSPVGLFPRSRSKAFGLEDMAGNVWEWCADVAPVTWLSGNPEGRSLRGGAFNYYAPHVQAAYRYANRAGNRHCYVGFRLARTYN